MHTRAVQKNPPEKLSAYQIIILFGLVSLFGDIVYEGARSVNGPYLKTLGASAFVVGLVAGIAEFLGYAIRLVSGYFSDRTKAYWLFTIIGYGMLISVPLLSLTGIWQVTAVFIVMERLGKALRSPAKDTIVSQAAKQIGTGFGFGLQEAMDQIGAIIGPLIFTGLFIYLGTGSKTIADYQKGYGFLWLPFILVMFFVTFAYLRAPNPEQLEIKATKTHKSDKLSRVFWIYTVFSFVTTLGFVNFILMGYHFKARNVLPDAQIPLFYALAMGIDGAVALVIGKMYDKFKEKTKNEKAGLLTLLIIPFCSILIPVFAFTNNHFAVIVGILLWGIVMGAHETIMKSAIADITPVEKRGTGYGIFNTSYGLAIFFGSTLMGFLYEKSIPTLIVTAVIVELAAIPLFFKIRTEALKY